MRSRARASASLKRGISDMAVYLEGGTDLLRALMVSLKAFLCHCLLARWQSGHAVQPLLLSSLCQPDSARAALADVRVASSVLGAVPIALLSYISRKGAKGAT